MMFYPTHIYIYGFNLVFFLYKTESFLSPLAYKSQFLCKFVNIKKHTKWTILILIEALGM